MQISKIKLPGSDTALDIKDTTYQFAQSGNTLQVGVNGGTKSNVYTPSVPAAANNGTFSVKTKVGSASAVTAADFTANQSSNDDITFVQGSNVTLTTDTTNRTVTIASTNTWRPLGTSADTACAGNDSRLSNARPASDVYSWAKQSSKPSYSFSEISGSVSSSQLPSYVDDVLEYASKSNFPSTGEAGKIYVAKDTNLTWRWSGSTYVEISPSLALGETSSTAYAGNKGKALADKLAGIESGAQVHRAPTAAEVKSALGTGSGTSKYLREDGSWVTPPNTDTNTWRPVQCNSTDIGSNTLNIVAGSNVTLTRDGGKITIASTDTNSWRPVSDSVSSTSSSDAASSKAVKTAYDLAASKTSNTGTVTKVSAGTGLTGGDITTTGTIALATSGVTAGTYRRVTVDAYGRVTSGDNADADTNTARLRVSDTTNKRINTAESTGNYIQFTAGTNKFTVTDGTNSFDVAVTPSVSHPVTSVAGNTGAVTTAQIATALANAGYKLTDNNTTYAAGTGVTISGTNNAINVTYGTSANTACQGNDSRLSNSRPASDVYSWAKASSKPTYIASEVMSISAQSISANTSSSCSITGSGNAGKAQTIVYVNSGSADVTVTVPTTYKTPANQAIELTCPAGGYCEVSYLNIGGTIYARGL